VRLFECLRTVAGLLLIVACACNVASARELDVPFRAIVPNSWTLLPRTPDSVGRRFISPSGDAWLRYFAVPVHAQGRPPTARGQATYEARGGDWTVTSGYRGDRIFYRRAMLACHNTKWREIEFESSVRKAPLPPLCHANFLHAALHDGAAMVRSADVQFPHVLRTDAETVASRQRRPE
jgi:hypothetical protein